MNMTIGGIGRVILSSPVPDQVLAKAYPYITPAMDSLNNVLWMYPSAYPEAYDEDEILSFLCSLLPYAKSGSMEYTLKISKEHAITWSFKYNDGHLDRVHYEGSCNTYKRIL